MTSGLTILPRLVALTRIPQLRRCIVAAIVILIVFRVTIMIALSPSDKDSPLEYPDLDYNINVEDLTDWKRKPKILILTLVHNSEEQLPIYRALLQHFSYPHKLITVALGEDGSSDHTAEKAKLMLNSLKVEFRRVEFFHLSELDGKFKELERANKLNPHAHLKHDEEYQYERRTHLAKARNLLLKKALKDEDWVLWLDSDIKKSPRNLIQKMLETRKTIIVPNCVIKYKHSVPATRYVTYDLNTWKETPASLHYQDKEKPDYLFLEGYDQKRPPRRHLGELYKEGYLVEVDGVGACALLIKAHHHRRGLMFPEEIYRNHIESEGLARMAQDMGIRLWAMPRIGVLHACNYESAHGECAD